MSIPISREAEAQRLVGLSLAAEHRRRRGALYDAVNQGRLEPARLRRAVAALPDPLEAAQTRTSVSVDATERAELVNGVGELGEIHVRDGEVGRDVRVPARRATVPRRPIRSTNPYRDE